MVKLTLQIKLLPTVEQARALLQTIKEANKACNLISTKAWEQKVFRPFKLHHACYYPVKGATQLSSQVIVRCISKVAAAYKRDRKVRRTFRPLGAVAYDSRILTYRPNHTVSIWSVGGRLKLPFVCHHSKYLSFIKGEADLLFRKGKFYLLQTVEIAEETVRDVEAFIGCDLDQTDICTPSDGTTHSSEQLKKVRQKYAKVRASVQAKGTRSSRRLLKRLRGRERRFVSITNHTIAKNIVEKARAEHKGLALEDLRHIRNTAKPKSKAHRTELNRWSFQQLRKLLTYKAQRKGVKLFVVPPAYTSQMCADCLWMGERKGKRFRCHHCGKSSDADHNAARNISTWGRVVNRPEESGMLSCAWHP